MSGCVVVTGASSGIGACVARRLIARGENVLAVARREDRLREVCGSAPNARFLVCDLSTEDSVVLVAKTVRESFGTVRGFVHCAGFNALAPLSLVDPATAQRLYAVHALFPMRFMGWLAKALNHDVGTACVLVSSRACHEGEKGNAAYAAAKGAVEGMLKGSAAELADRGVRLNVVAPGIVETEMARTMWMDNATPEVLTAKRAGFPFGFGKPEQVADVIEFFLGPQSSWVTGQCLIVDGGRGVTL